METDLEENTMTDGVALNGRPLSEVADNHAALFSGQPSPYDGITDFNRLLTDAMRQFLDGDQRAEETYRLALRERAGLLASPEIKANDDARAYLDGIIVKHENPLESLKQTVAMHGYVEDPTYKGEPPTAKADADDGGEPVAIL